MSLFIYNYLFMYSISIFFFFSSLHQRVTNVYLMRLSWDNLIIFIKQFDPILSMFTYVFISLAGVPPFFLFFWKLSLFIFICQDSNIYCLVIVIVIFFNGTLYYLKIFSKKSHNSEIIKLNLDFLTFLPKTNLYYSIKMRGQLAEFIFITRLFYLLLFSFFGFPFFIDFYFIFYLFI